MAHQILKYSLLCLCLCFFINTYAQSVSFTYDKAGNRTGQTVFNFNKAKSKSQTPDSTAINDQLGQQSIKFYPNPTKEYLGIESVGSTTDIQVVIHDSNGKLVVKTVAGSGFSSINLSSLPSGWYLLRLNNGSKTKEYKIIKE